MLAALVLGLVPLLQGHELRWSLDPPEVEVGQPFELTLAIEHDPGAEVPEVNDESLADAAGFVVFGHVSRPSTDQGAKASGRLVRRHVWTLVALDPGSHRLPTDRIALVGGSPAAKESPPPLVVVEGVLAENEDAPRPLRSFAADFLGERGASSRWYLWGAGGLAGLVLLGLLWIVRRRQGRTGAPAPPPSVQQRFEALGATPDADRERWFELAALVREAIDRYQKAPRPGLTDEEWLASLPAHSAGREFPDEVRQGLGEVLERCARVRYAGEQPTAWAFEEVFARARVALKTALVPRTAATGSNPASQAEVPA